MLSYITGGFLALAILGCLASIVAGNVYIYIICFLLFIISIMFWLFTLLVNFSRKILPQNLNKTTVIGSAVCILFIALLSLFSTAFFTTEKTEEAQSFDRLKALGYVSWGPAEKSLDKRGVVHYNPELAYGGLNLYNSLTLPEAYLIDMHGNIVHKWSKKIEGCNAWDQHVEMYNNGDLLVVAAHQMLICLDWNSNIKWKKTMAVHHDVYIDENRRVYALTHERELVFWQGIPAPIGNDYVVVISPDGKVEKKISVYSLVKDHVPFEKIAGLYKGLIKILDPNIMLSLSKNIVNRSPCNVTELFPENYFDILHTNTIEIIDRNIEGFCTKGDWLVSIRQLDLVGVVDTQKMDLTWSWGPGELSRQHHPTLLKNGNLLIYDNGVSKELTRIVEVHPLTKTILWEYKSESPEKFYSALMGSSQRFPNGNTLITESDKGRVFEITREGKVVWEFYNPNINMESKKRETIYRMTRIFNPEIHKLIETEIYNTF